MAVQTNPILSRVFKFGRNVDVDSAAPEDIWDVGGAYPFPPVAATTTAVSVAATDTPGGTGVSEIQVEGVDAEFNFVVETIQLAGLTPVTLQTQFFRVFRVFGLVAGSSETNDGNISVSVGATVVALMLAGNGQTAMAIFTVPIGQPAVILAIYGFFEAGPAGASATFRFLTRRPNGPWTLGFLAVLDANNPHFLHPIVGKVAEDLPPKNDIRVEVIASANNTDVAAGFDLEMIRRG